MPSPAALRIEAASRAFIESSRTPYQRIDRLEEEVARLTRVRDVFIEKFEAEQVENKRLRDKLVMTQRILAKYEYRAKAGDQVIDVVSAVAGRHGFAVSEILADTSKKHQSMARHEVYYSCIKSFPHMSIQDIAAALGRHHTTVAFGCSQHIRKNGLPPIGRCPAEVSARRLGMQKTRHARRMAQAQAERTAKAANQ